MNTTSNEQVLASLKLWIFSLEGVVIVVLNSVVIVLSLAASNVKNKQYRVFLLNLAIIECIFGFALIIFQAPPHTGMICKLGGAVVVYGSVAIVQGPVAVLASRYLTVCHHHVYGSLSQCYQTVPLLLYPYLISAPVLVVGYGSYGDMMGLCAARPNLPIIVYSLVVTGLMQSLNVFFTVGIVRKLKELEGSQQRLGQGAAEELRTTRFLLRAVWLQTLSPTVLSIPTMLLALFSLPEDGSPIYIFLVGTYSLSAVVDPIFTISIVKPYRSAFLRGTRRVLGVLPQSVMPIESIQDVV